MSQYQGQRVLLVNAVESVCAEIARAIEQAGFHTTHAPGFGEAREALGSGDYSAVIIRHSAAADGLAAFWREARSADGRLVIIPAVGRFDEKLEGELFEGGVDDVITDRHTPKAAAKRLTVRLRRRS